MTTALPRALRWNLIATDVGFIVYWLLIAADALPPEWAFKDYENPIMVAWNWSFAPLDLLASATGLVALVAARRGHPGGQPLALVSGVLTFCAGFLALSFWTLRREFDWTWWLPNVYLMIWPIACLLPAIFRPAGKAAPDAVHGAPSQVAR